MCVAAVFPEEEGIKMYVYIVISNHTLCITDDLLAFQYTCAPDFLLVLDIENFIVYNKIFYSDTIGSLPTGLMSVDGVRPADHTMEVARAIYKSEISDVHVTRGNTSNESLDDKETSITDSPVLQPRPRNNRADNNTPAAAWKRSLPKSMISPNGNERKGPEPVNRTESLMNSRSSDQLDQLHQNSSRESADPGMLEYIKSNNDGVTDKPLSSVRPPSIKRMSSSSSSLQLAPIVPPATNVEPLAAKTILGSIRRGINPARDPNIVSTLNIIDNQMAMAGIGVHSRASLFVSLLDDSAQHSILNKPDLANSWEALRTYLVENKGSKAFRKDVMEDFMQCARSITAGNAESCARLAVEQLELMKPTTTPRLGIPTFIAAVPDEHLRADFHDLYEMSLSAMDAESDDDNACTISFIEAAKLIDRRMNSRASANGGLESQTSKSGRKGHRRGSSLGSGSDVSKLSHSKSRSSLNRGSSTSFQSVHKSSRLKKQTTRVYDRLTGEEHVVERDAPAFREGYADDNESIVSGRSAKSGKSKFSRGTSAFDKDKSNNKSIVSVYNYPKNLPLAQLVELTTPPAGKAPVMIRHKDGLVKILYSNSAAATEVSEMINNCTVNNVALGAICEIRGVKRSDESLNQQATFASARPTSTGSYKRQPSFAVRTPQGDKNHGPPLPAHPQQPVFPEKQDVTQLWDSDTELFVGSVSLVLAALCLGFGNGFESNSPLAYMHIFFLLIGFEFFNRGMEHAWHGFVLSVGVMVISQSLGSLIGFAYFFSYPNRNALTVNVTLLFSCILWLAIALLAVMLEYAYRYKFPDWSSVPFVFPAAHTMITTVMFGERFGVYFALGNAVADYAPLRQVAAAFGIGGLHFIAVLIPTMVFLKVIRHEFKPPNTHTIMYYTLAVIALITTMGFVQQSDYLYQRSVHEGGYHPSAQVACITGRDYGFNSERYNEVFASSQARLAAGDAIVMWAERTLSINNDVNENTMLRRAQRLVKDFSVANTSYLGVSYQKIEASRRVRDKFFLIGPGGDIVMKHEKVAPIPFLDDNVLENENKELVWYDTSAYGKLGVGLGFDVSNPSYMRQAGKDRVDILLQPLWSHSGIGRRRFDVDSIRAIENGFTLFRCDSNGVSGIVGPRGEVLSKEYVALDPKKPNLYSLPLRKRVSTFYNMAGFAFDYICVAFTCVFWLLTLIPWAVLDAISSMFRNKEEKKHNFVITRARSSDEFEMGQHLQPVGGEGNPFDGVSETRVDMPDEFEEEEDDGRFNTYYNHVDYGGDEV